MKKTYNIPVIEVKTIGTEGIIAHSDVSSSSLKGTSSGGNTSQHIGTLEGDTRQQDIWGGW